MSGRSWGWLVLWLAPALGCQAQTLIGVVTRVSDGDTVWLRPAGGKPLKVRLEGIDAPERCQPWGPQASEALRTKLLNRQATLQTRARDDYRRVVGTLRLDDEDVGAWMVREGHAWSYRYRRHPGPYAAQEQEARAARRGLFAQPDAIEPRRFRRLHGTC